MWLFNISIDKLKKEVALFDRKYIVLNTEIPKSGKVQLLHKVCGTKYPVVPKEFLKGKSLCPLCLEKRQVGVQREIDHLTNKSYDIVGKFKGMDQPITLHHHHCDTESEYESVNSFMEVPRCLVCFERFYDKLWV